MAKGFASCHPYTVAILEGLGVVDSDVLQGVGNAPASAGTHAKVGTYQGVGYGPAVDLRYGLADPDFIDRCWEAGLVAFVRNAASGWSGGAHIHSVCLGLVDAAGNKHLPPICNTQVTDFLSSPPKSGLAGHGFLQGSYKPTPAIQAKLRKQYQAWWPGFAVKVLSPEGHPIPSYAQLEGDTVTVETGVFCSYWEKHPALPTAVYDGRFYRVPVRDAATALGLKVAGFSMNATKTAATVKLAY